MKYSSRHYVRQTPKIYGNLHPEPRSRAGAKRFLVLFLGSAALIGFVYFFWFSSYFRVHTVQVQGTHLVSASSIVGLVPQGVPIWFVPKDQIIGQILEDPRVQSVAFYRGLPDSIRLVIEERKPILTWQSGTNLYLVDATGEVFLQYPIGALPTDLATLPLVVDTRNVPVKLGQNIVSPIFMSFIQTTHQQLHSLLPQVSVDHWEIGETIYEATMLTKQGLKVEFTTLGDAGVEVRNLTRLIHQNKATLTSNVNLTVDRWAYVQ